MDIFLMIRRKKQTIFTDCKDSTTVFELKKMIEGILKVPPSDQQLFYKEDCEMQDSQTLFGYGLTVHTAKAQSPAQIGLALREDCGVFESLDLTPYSAPPDLPDVMKTQDANNGTSDGHLSNQLPFILIEASNMAPALWGVEQLLPWHQKAPQFTTFRVNTLITTPEEFVKVLENAIEQLASALRKPLLPVWQHPLLSELVLVGSWESPQLDLYPRDTEVIVDASCGAAVLRGAHIFAPGVMGLSPGATVGEVVSVYADLSKVCNRGSAKKLPNGDGRLFLGNGILQMGRKQLFNQNTHQRGIAVHMTDSSSGCPALPMELCEGGSAVMQNLPSVVCGRVLDPQPGEVVLDMCAAPGNKTTHLGALMQNKGLLIAVDKSASRVTKLQQTCNYFSVSNVRTFTFDSVKAVREQMGLGWSTETLISGPPFPAESFDRILLDAPCSGLGQRPHLESIDFKHVTSFPPLQRKLFKTAVQLLKPGGVLVYSTCTILEAENEGMVRWAVDNFPNLQLVRAEPYLADNSSFKGITTCTSNATITTTTGSVPLSSAEYSCVQIFGPCEQPVGTVLNFHRDTIGFFIARFMKQTQGK